MKKYLLSLSGMAAFVLLLSCGAMAQDRDKDKDKDKDKEKTGKLGDYDEIIIKRKTDKDGKVTIEVNKDGDVTVNGKPLEDYDNEDLSVRKRSMPRYGVTSPFRNQEWSEVGGGNSFNRGFADRAFLGVTSEKTDDGIRVTNISEGSAAEKAGLKEGDIIKKVDDAKIEDPEDLFTVIGKHKPEDKVSITYTRDGKDHTTTATLGKRSGSQMFSFNGPEGVFPRIETMPDMHGFNFSMPDGDIFYRGNKPRLGIKAQDTEDGKGVKVLSVGDESNAEKAGIEEGDIITEFDGTAVNSADDLAKAAENAKTKSSVKVKFLRDGKSQTVEVKLPKKLKTANL